MKKSLLFGVLLSYTIFNLQAKIVHEQVIGKISYTKNNNTFIEEKRTVIIDKSEIKDPYIINEKLINYITVRIMIFKSFITNKENSDVDYLLRHERYEIIELFKEKQMRIDNIEGITEIINNDFNEFSKLKIAISGSIVHKGKTIAINSIVFDRSGIYVQCKEKLLLYGMIKAMEA